MSHKLTQELRQEQSLSLSPVQLLSTRLTELTNLELEARIEHELEDNPALEEGPEEAPDTPREDEPESNDSGEDEDWELGEYASEDDIPAYKLQEIQERQNYREEIPFAASAPSLDDFLLEQLHYEGLSEREESLARYIIGNISTDGYLERSSAELEDDLLFHASLDYSPRDIEQMIERIQGLEPAGIGARDLRECLLLQLRRQQPEDQGAIRMLTDYYDDFVQKRFDLLAERLGLSRPELSELYSRIARLNPKPGAAYSTDDASRLIHLRPDFLIEEEDDGTLSLTIVGERDIRPLRLSPQYQEILLRSEQEADKRKRRETTEFLKRKLEQARWFIEALNVRQDTLRRTMLAIMEWQHDFLLSGDIHDLRPMILKDIAGLTGLDISTISRVSNSKNVQTRHGIYPVKYFFGDGLTTDSGAEISTRAIKLELQRLIENEDKQKPLTDEELARALSKAGYPLARRTIAKYREALHLPIARLRREV